MLKIVSKILILSTMLLIYCCSNDLKSTTNKLKTKSEQTVGEVEYKKVYQIILDSVHNWANAGLGYYKYLGSEKNYDIDSLICFNNQGNRIVTALLTSHKKSAQADGIDFLYGEKINENWYFFSGAYITVPRSMIKDHEASNPLSYQKLHEVALKEVFNGYLNSFGNIDESWFTRHFESSGMCGECKTREDFQKNIIEGGAAKWKYRDTTQAIKLLPKKDTLIP